MTELERLTVLIEECAAIHESGFAPDKRVPAEALARYLLGNGVILPPVKVGQTVYFLRYNEVCEAKVIFMEINLFTDPQLWLSVEYYSLMFGTHTYKTRIDLMLGKIVFLTREEAEAELEKRRKEKKRE